MLSLRPYQSAALDAIRQAADEGLRRVLVAHATGLGKTVLFSHLLASKHTRSLVLVHRDELVQQSIEKLSIIAPELQIGVVKAERDETDADVVVASVQTVSRQGRLQRLGRAGSFGTIVVDEAHHATATSYQTVLQHLGALDPERQNVLTLGLTATPERADGAKLGVTWEKIVHRISILQGILDGYLVDIRAQTIGTDAELDEVGVSRGDLVASQLGQALVKADAMADAAEGYVKYAADRRGIAFTPTVDTAMRLAWELRQRGIRAEMVHGGTPTDERRDILARLRSGQTQVVANCAVLTEGFDEPSVSCIMVCRPTRSNPLFVQMIGRGTRPYPGKEDLLVLDISGATERNDLISVGDLVGGPLEEGTLTEAAERIVKEQGEAKEREYARARKTRAVDLFRSKLRWLPVKPGFCLPLGDSTLVLVPDTQAGTWSVLRKTKAQVDLLYDGLPLGYAQGIGEDLARSAGVLNTIAKRDAYWATLVPTNAQLGRLRRYGMAEEKIGKVRSRGQASDLITRAEAMKLVRRHAK